jgi:hypothetical protein
MANDIFRFKMTSYEDPELCFSIHYNGDLIQFSSFDENGRPCKYGCKMDHTTFADLQKKMQQEIDVLKNQTFQTDQEHMLYWNVKDEVDGISVSCDGHIEINENIKQKKNLFFQAASLTVACSF